MHNRGRADLRRGLNPPATQGARDNRALAPALIRVPRLSYPFYQEGAFNMPTINDVISQCESELSTAEAREAEARGQIGLQIETAQSQGRSNFTAAEDQRTEDLFRTVEHARAAQRRARTALERARAVEDDERRYQVQLADVRDTGARPARRTASVSVGREARTYNPGTDPNGRNFLLDVARAAIFDDVRSRQRLEAHSREEDVERPGYSQRVAGDATTASYGVGLVVPAYLTDLYAPAIAAMRPVANIANHHDLPPNGMTLNLSKITTATSAALQASQLASVSSTSIGETDLSINVLTIAGSQNVSRQAIERGTGIEDVTTQDLFKRVATTLDSTILTQAFNGYSGVGSGRDLYVS